METTRRLFFALSPDPQLRLRLAALSAGAWPITARKVEPANLHLTLLFIGAADQTLTALLQQAAGKVTAGPFDLSLQRIGYWRQPRIIWLAPLHTPAGLSQLVAELRHHITADCRLAPESRPYRPHLTLARHADSCNDYLTEPLAWHVDRFSLFESCSTPHGVRYHELDRWPLKERQP